MQCTVSTHHVALNAIIIDRCDIKSARCAVVVDSGQPSLVAQLWLHSGMIHNDKMPIKLHLDAGHHFRGAVDAKRR